MEKKSEAYKTIGEVAEIVGLIDKKRGTLSTHTIRFWEKEFSQIKPKILSGKRRYYSNKEIRIIKLIKYLLKEKGMTIKGVKAVLNNQKSLTLDDTTKYSVSNQSQNKEKIKDKIKKKELYLLIHLGFGKKNLVKSNQKFYQEEEDIIVVKKFA